MELSWSRRRTVRGGRQLDLARAFPALRRLAASKNQQREAQAASFPAWHNENVNENVAAECRVVARAPSLSAWSQLAALISRLPSLPRQRLLRCHLENQRFQDLGSTTGRARQNEARPASRSLSGPDRLRKACVSIPRPATLPVLSEFLGWGFWNSAQGRNTTNVHVSAR